MAQEQQGQGRPPIMLYTDGASSGNPGPGGYGVVLRCGTYEKELSGGYSLTTNNRMELLAVIKGLEAINWSGAQVHVWSDSSDKAEYGIPTGGEQQDCCQCPENAGE